MCALANFLECSIVNPTVIGFEEISSYWSVQYFLLFIGQCSNSLLLIGHHLDCTFTGMDKNRPYNPIGPDCASHA